MPKLSFWILRMAKKDKSRTPIKLPENTFIEEGNNSLKQFGSEIGEIFSEEKTKKPLTEKAEKTNRDTSRTPAELQENTSTEEGNSSLKKPGTEIDDIFAGKKRKKPLTEKTEKPNNYAISRPKKMKNKKDKGFNDDGFGDSYSRPRRKTQDGFTIYSEEELGLSKVDAGGTPLCPFDCSCCF